MNKFERWFLKRIIKREVQQDYSHWNRHVNLYQMIRDAHREEFTEDNLATADAFLLECFEETQYYKNIFGILRK